jgi:hypothetical protein
MRAGIAGVLAVVLAVSCGGSQDAGPDAAPEDPFAHLMKACTKYAEAACAKNAECLPPADASCMSTQLASCLTDGQQDAPTCVPAAASAIDGCVGSLTAMTCADYCSTSGGFTFCFAPCIWFCP